MSSAFPAIGTFSTEPGIFIKSWTTHLPSEALSPVVFTSIQTETIYPTWIYTISDSEPGTSSTAITVLNFESPTLNPTPVTVTPTTTYLSATQLNDVRMTTISEPSISESSVIWNPTTTPLSKPTEDAPFPTSSGSSESHSQHSDTLSTVWIPQITSTSSGISLSSVLSALPGAATSAMISVSALTSSSTVLSSTPSLSPLIGGATGASSSDTAQADQSRPTPTKIGTIVGSIIGGSAFFIFTLLACALFIRRRRRKSSTERLSITQKPLRGDSMTSSVGHHRYPSYPSILGNISPRSPKLPIIPLQHSNPDVSLDSMYLREERAAQNPLTDYPSTVIEISAPSRSVSIYSSSSWGNGDGISEWDCEHEGADSLAVPRASSGYLDTPMMRDSMRSDPFDLDLEPPPNAQLRPSAPPLPTPWGVKF